MTDSSQGPKPKASPPPDVLLRRQRNTIAARKYRQKTFDRIEELEKALATALQERDDLKLLLARRKGETEALKRALRTAEDEEDDRLIE